MSISFFKGISCNSVPEQGQGTEVSKMAIREGIVFWGILGGFPCYRLYLTTGVERGVGGASPHYRRYLVPLRQKGVWKGSSPHSRAYPAP